MKNLTEIQMQNRMIKDLIIFIFLPENAVTVASVQSFADNAALLKTHSGKVTDLFALYVEVLKGIAKKRRDARIALAQQSFIFMQAARAWFISQGNTVDAEKMDIPLSILERKGYVKLGEIILSAQNTIAPEVANLAPSNITPAKFLAWQNQLAAYSNLQSAYSGVTDRKTIGEQIVTAMGLAMTTLKTQCDTTVHSIEDEIFVGNYFNKRRLVREGVHHTGARVQLQSETGDPFGPGITVTVDSFTKKDRTFKAVSDLSDNEGIAHPSSFEPGERTITVSGEAIVTKTFGPYIFHKAKILDLTLICTPKFNLPQPQNPQQNPQANNS
jgi:hypothetical protein